MFSFGTQTNTNLWTFNDDKSGLQFSQTSDIENAYKDLFKRIFPDINLDPSTPAGQIITYLTEQDTATIQGIQDFVNYFFFGVNKIFLIAYFRDIRTKIFIYFSKRKRTY